MQLGDRDPFRWQFSPAELWADGLVHAVGVVLVLTGVIAFAVMLPGRGDAAELTAAVIYLATLALSIGASAAYNIWPVSPIKWGLRRLDHSAIYFLIAGTYTPFMAKISTWGMLACVWSIAVFGVLLKVFRPGRFDRLSIVLYLALGWSGIATYDRLVATLPQTVIWLIIGGGIVYSLGVIFHVAERLRFQNAIWHGFVLVAAVIHFLAVWSVMSRP